MRKQGKPYKTVGTQMVEYELEADPNQWVQVFWTWVRVPTETDVHGEYFRWAPVRVVFSMFVPQREQKEMIAELLDERPVTDGTTPALEGWQEREKERDRLRWEGSFPD